jgi:IS5 family transposase
MPIPQCLEGRRAGRGAVSGGAEAIGGGRVRVEDRDFDRRHAGSVRGPTAAAWLDARDQESRSPHDPDANWTREGKARRLFFGYKAHIGVDQGSGLIRSRALTGAKTYESEVADALVMGDERAVYLTKPMRNTPGAQL